MAKLSSRSPTKTGMGVEPRGAGAREPDRAPAHHPSAGFTPRSRRGERGELDAAVSANHATGVQDLHPTGRVSGRPAAADAGRRSVEVLVLCGIRSSLEVIRRNASDFLLCRLL